MGTAQLVTNAKMWKTYAIVINLKKLLNRCSDLNIHYDLYCPYCPQSSSRGSAINRLLYDKVRRGPLGGSKGGIYAKQIQQTITYKVKT